MRQIAAFTIVSLLLGSLPASAQSAPTTKPRNPNMGLAGLIVAGAGIGLALPTGDTYEILGDRFCVTQRAVDYGACSVSSARRRVGLFMLAAGGAMSAFGFSRVRISPTYKGATATVTVAW